MAIQEGIKNEKALRFASILLATCMFTALWGCSQQRTAPDEMMYSKGLEVAGDLEELAGSQTFLDIWIGMGNISELVSGFAQVDSQQPDSVYRVNIADSIVDELGLSDFTASLNRKLENQLVGVISSVMTARASTTALAASSSACVKDSFLCEEITSSRIYFYLYGSDYRVSVAFSPCSDGTVMVTGNLCISFELEDIRSASDFESLLPKCEIACEAENVLAGA